VSEEIVVGRMLDPMRIRTQEQTTVEVTDWAKRAMWSYLRLEYGRSIDKEIRSRRDDWLMENYGLEAKQADRGILKLAMENVFAQIFAEHPLKKPRNIQFILDGDFVHAVASRKHLLVSPEKVYIMAAEIIRRHYPQLQPFQMKGMAGQTYLLKEVAGFKVGLQLYGGDIYTREAISLSSWLRVEMCFNPLSWLGMGFFHNFVAGRETDFERMLRIKVITDLKPRLQQAIELGLKRTDDIERRVKAVQKVAVKRADAEIILSALGLSYDLGAKAIDQILEQLEKEPKTQWGMSMASSYVAAHGKFKETPEGLDRKVEQKLSTISGAALLLDDLKDAKERSIEWLQSHVKEGQVKTVDELISRLGIGKVKKQ
jgi:hypothetical protein